MGSNPANLSRESRMILSSTREATKDELAAEMDRRGQVIEALEARLARVIPLSRAEMQSGLNRVRYAELLIEQMPESHDGAGTWLLNFGVGDRAKALRDKRGIGFDEQTWSAHAAAEPTTPPRSRTARKPI